MLSACSVFASVFVSVSAVVVAAAAIIVDIVIIEVVVYPLFFPEQININIFDFTCYNPKYNFIPNILFI